jgi:hypothetical protein
MPNFPNCAPLHLFQPVASCAEESRAGIEDHVHGDCLQEAGELSFVAKAVQEEAVFQERENPRWNPPTQIDAARCCDLEAEVARLCSKDGDKGVQRLHSVLCAPVLTEGGRHDDRGQIRSAFQCSCRQ